MSAEVSPRRSVLVPMEGNPAEFESVGSRLGFRLQSESSTGATLVWLGARFPAFLCLGIAAALLFLSIPILEALRQRGLAGPAGALWYFPAMNLILFGIALYLVSLKRTILLDNRTRQIVLERRSLFGRRRLRADYDEVAALSLGSVKVYSGFAVAGSSADRRYPVPSLRLVLKNGQTVLLDRGGRKRLENLGKRLNTFLGKPLETTDRFLQ